VGHWTLDAALIPYDLRARVERAGARALLVPPSAEGVEETLMRSTASCSAAAATSTRLVRRAAQPRTRDLRDDARPRLACAAEGLRARREHCRLHAHRIHARARSRPECLAASRSAGLVPVVSCEQPRRTSRGRGRAPLNTRPSSASSVSSTPRRSAARAAPGPAPLRPRARSRTGSARRRASNAPRRLLYIRGDADDGLRPRSNIRSRS